MEPSSTSGLLVLMPTETQSHVMVRFCQILSEKLICPWTMKDVSIHSRIMYWNGHEIDMIITSNKKQTMINNTIHFSAAWIAPYVILDTDYENFSCIYSCSGYNFGYYSDFAFIFSRSPTLADRYYRRCEAAFMNIGVEPSRFSKTTQGSSCPYSSHRSW